MTELKKLNAGDDKLDAVYDGGALEVSSDNNPQIDVVTEEYKGTIRGLHPRHLQLITISGAIGTGLFVRVFVASFLKVRPDQCRSEQAGR